MSVRRDIELVGPVPWLLVDRGLRCYEQLRFAADDHGRQIAKDALNREFKNAPEVRLLLKALSVRPQSGEFKLLRHLMF